MKLIVSDMDGTLTYDLKRNNLFAPNETEIPIENKFAINTFISDSNTFAIATGRLLSDVQNTIGEKLFNNIYKIVQNGSFIFDKKNCLINSTVYECSIFNEIVNTLKSNNVAFCFSDSQQHYYSSSLTREEMNTIFGSQTPKIPYNTKKNYQNIANICVTADNLELLKQINYKLRTLLNPELVNFQITSHRTIDINPVSVNKGNSVVTLMKMFKLKNKDIFVVGDSYNDLSMFQLYENSFCMNHSEEDLKKQAKFHIDMFADLLNIIN